MTLAITNRLLSINHTPGRGGMAIDMVTIHVTEGSAASVRSWFAAPAAQVSAHYMVCVDGAIDQFVREEDQAWHNGRVDHPTAPLVVARPNVNPNRFSVGIEHEGTGTAPLTAPQRAASVALIRDICTRRGIPFDRTHIVGHREVFSRKTCPGAIDVDALVREATPGAEPAPRLVWSPYMRDFLIVTEVRSDTEWSYVRLSEAVSSRAPTWSTVSLRSMPTVAA